MNRWISRIVAYWTRAHPPCARIPGWKAAQEAERRARASGYTQGVHRARMAKRDALHSNLKGA